MFLSITEMNQGILFFCLCVGLASSLRSVCYYTNWSQYRTGAGKFFPEDIDPSHCTHLIYAFAKLDAQNHMKAFEWNDESETWAKGLYERFNDLKQKNPSLKTSVAIGGWNMGSAPFTKMVASDASRLDFARDAIKFLRDRNFDGLDLDWEYPAGRGSPPGDKAKYTELVKILRREFDAEASSSGKDALLLSAAIPAGKDHIDAGFDIPAISNYLDMFNLMSYDLHGSWETFTGHNSPLFARSDETGDQRHLNLDWAARYWVQHGAPKSKMNIGMGLYGRSFTLSSSDSVPGAPVRGAGKAGQMTHEKGFLAYYEICEMQKQGGVVHRMKEQMVPYIVLGDQWVGYDDPQSLTDKVNYVKQNGYGGIMVWALPLDDFKGQCGQGKYPLMSTIVSVLNDGSSHPVNHVTAAPQLPVTTDHSQQNTVKPAHTTKAPTMSDHHFACAANGNGFFPSPTSCSHYFVCVGGVSYPFFCKEGLLYNQNTLMCDYAANVNCNIHGHQLPVTAAPTSAPVHVNHVSPATPAPHVDTSHNQGSLHQGFCASQSDGLHADPADCQSFYNCANHITYHQRCAPGTAFDSNTHNCVFLNSPTGCH